MEVELPQYYMALVLADTSQGAPNADHLEASRLATIDYLLKHLQPIYPTLTTLDLEFDNLQWKSEKPLPRFHVYWEVNTTAQFESSDDDDDKTKPSSSPNPEELFESVGEAFDEDYREFLLQTVKGGGDISSNTTDVEGFLTPLESAKEVQVRRTKLPTAGGAVKAPPFYMAFVTSEEPTRKPNAEEISKAEKHIHDAVIKELRKKYQDGFQELKLLKIKRTEIGERAGIPQDEFKLYVELEAVGEFTENTPEAMEFFRVISLVNQPEFILAFDDVGGPFNESEQIAMNVCAWFENGEEPPEEETEPDDPDMGEQQPQDEPPVLVDVHLEFWVALVIPQLEELPTEEKTQKFDEIIAEFVVDNVLKKQYKEKFHDWTVEPEPPKFEAGLPLLRFNMLHGYNATLQFQDPPPEPTDVLQRIVKCEVSMLMKKLKELKDDEDDPDSTRPWKETTEATFGSAFNPDPNDKVYGGKIDRKVPVKKKKKTPEPAPASSQPKFKGKPKKKAAAAEEEKPKSVAKFKGVPKKKQPVEPPQPKFKGKPKKKLEEERIAKEKAEEEERRKREEEEQKKREEEEEKKRLEEEEKKRQEEEELRKQKELEEQKRREEEEKERKRKEEEQRRRKEEEDRKRLEELRKQKEMEEQRRREEEERKRQEEEEARRKAAEEEDRKRLEELRKQKEMEEQSRREEEERKRQEEEEARRKAAEEEARRKAAEEEARRKAAEEEARRKAAEEEARRQAAEEEARRKAAEEEARRKAAEEEEALKKAEEEEARKKAEEEARIAKEKAEAEKAAKKKKKAKKEKKEHPKPKVPPQEPLRPKPVGKQVATSDVYVALDVWYQKSEPTEEEFNALVNQTRDYYDKHLKKVWGDIYNGVEVSIRHKEYGTKRPNKNYNVYVEWDIVTYFEDGKEPKRYDVMVSLVRDMEVIGYLQYLRELENMCWANACGILHQQTVNDK